MVLDYIILMKVWVWSFYILLSIIIEPLDARGPAAIILNLKISLSARRIEFYFLGKLTT